MWICWKETLQISGQLFVEFKPMLFKGQLYIITFVVPCLLIRIQVTVWAYFHSEELPSVFYNAGLLTTNSFIFYLQISWVHFHFWKGSFADYRILGWQCFLWSLRVLSHGLLVSIDFAEKSAVNLPRVPLKVDLFFPLLLWKFSPCLWLSNSPPPQLSCICLWISLSLFHLELGELPECIDWY